MGKKLYQWQEDCLKRWFSNQCRGTVQAVTGSGKTLLALTAAKRLQQQLKQELYVKIVVPTGALMRQWNRALSEFLSEASGKEAFARQHHSRIGLRGGGQKSPPDCRYMIYVINSARYELARQILSELKGGKAVFLIADECHRYGSGQNSLIFEFYPHIEPFRERYFSLGLSATLSFGEENSDMEAALGPRIYRYGMAEAAAHCTVCRYNVFHIGLSFREEERNAYDLITDQMTKLHRRLLAAYPSLSKLSQKERFAVLKTVAGGKNRKMAETAEKYMALSYKRKNLICMAEERIFCACALAERLDDREKILVFGERIRQADELYRLLEERYPGKVGRYHSQMGQQANKNALERFRMGELRILIACKAIDEGVDIPDASIGIILSGTSAERQRIQRLGRIIRKKEEKGRASLYYLHIEDSSEDTVFLPDSGETDIFELAYQSETGGFSNAPYDKASKILLQQLLQEGADGRTIEEAKRCLKLGSIRPDWKMGQDELAERIQRAGGIREKNYWVCMKRLQAVL